MSCRNFLFDNPCSDSKQGKIALSSAPILSQVLKNTSINLGLVFEPVIRKMGNRFHANEWGL